MGHTKMECLYSNYFNTITLCTVNNGTDTVLYMIDRDQSQQFASSGDNSDATTTTIQLDFADTQTVDRIILENINFKGFKIYYNSNTANLFSLTGSLTGTSEWASNSETSLCLICNTVTNISSIFIEATLTMIGNEEKKCGQFWTTRRYFDFVDNPSADNYEAKFYAKQFVHEMSDGGFAVYNIAKRFQSDIKREFVEETEHDTLKDLFEENSEFVFVPFQTGTSWDKRVYEVNWVGK